MNIESNKMLIWFLRQTRLMQYFILALAVHLLVILFIGSVKVAAYIPTVIAEFGLPGLSDQPGTAGDILPSQSNFVHDQPQISTGGRQSDAPADTPPRQFTTSVVSPTTDAGPMVAAVIGVRSTSPNAINLRPPGMDGVLEPPPPGSVVALNVTQGGIGSGTVGSGGSFMGGVVPSPGSLLGNRTEQKRQQALVESGGDVRTEQAVLAALRYLKGQQQADGSWGQGGYKIGLSARVTLAFLGRGETPDSTEFGPTVGMALKYLYRSVGPEGRLQMAGRLHGDREGYQIPIVALALSEAFAMTEAPELRVPVEKLIQQIVTAQKVPKEAANQGGWRYAVDSKDADLSVSVWTIMALKSARDAGIKVDQQVFNDAVRYINACYKETGTGRTKTGGFSYTAGGNPSASMTAAGILGAQFLGSARDARVRTALDYLFANSKMDWTDGQPSNWPIYGWYYATLAFFQAQDIHRDQWQTWNRNMINTLVTAQNKDGSWSMPPFGGGEAGHSGDTVGKPGLYTTALCTLMLEVYYRYLPIYKHVPKPVTEGTPHSIPLVSMVAPY